MSGSDVTPGSGIQRIAIHRETKHLAVGRAAETRRYDPAPGSTVSGAAAPYFAAVYLVIRSGVQLALELDQVVNADIVRVVEPVGRHRRPVAAGALAPQLGAAVISSAGIQLPAERRKGEHIIVVRRAKPTGAGRRPTGRACAGGTGHPRQDKDKAGDKNESDESSRFHGVVPFYLVEVEWRSA